MLLKNKSTYFFCLFVIVLEMLSLQTQLKNLKVILKNKNDYVKSTKEIDKEQLNNYLLAEIIKKDTNDNAITLEEALKFEIEYINNKNNKISSIRKLQTKKKTKIDL